MECCADILIDVKHSAYFFGRLRGEPGISVTDDLSGDAVVWEDVLHIGVCDGPGVSCFVDGNKEG